MVELDSNDEEIPIEKKLTTDDKKDEAEKSFEIVPFYKKPIPSVSSEDDEEECKDKVSRFGYDFSANPLSAYNTFVCHLGNWNSPLKNFLKTPKFRSIFDFVRTEYDSKV